MAAVRYLTLLSVCLSVEIMSDAFGKNINDKHTIKYEILSVNSPKHAVGLLSDDRRDRLGTVSSGETSKHKDSSLQYTNYVT